MYGYYHFKCQKHDRKKISDDRKNRRPEWPGQVGNQILYEAKVNSEQHCFDIHLLKSSSDEKSVSQQNQEVVSKSDLEY